MIISNSLIAVVVLYKTRIDESLSIFSLANSILAANWDRLELVIYDNSPEYNSNSILENPSFNIHYIPDCRNSGVSRAYNMASQIGKKLHKKYLLLLDQDTKFPLSFCKDISFVETHCNLIFPKLIDDDAIISPCKYWMGRGSFLCKKDCVEGVQSIKNRNFLNSGSVVSISLFDKVGGFDETVPLYFSDFNFFNRVRKYESHYYQLSICLQHKMSSNDENNIEQFKKRFELYCDGALRCYRSLLGLMLMIINIILRSIEVGVRHRTFRFVRIAIKKIYVFFA